MCADLSELWGEGQRKISAGNERIQRKAEHCQYKVKKKDNTLKKGKEHFEDVLGFYVQYIYLYTYTLGILKVTVNFSSI